MTPEDKARARGALQHLMYCARQDLDDADLSGLYQAEIEIGSLIEQSQPVPELPAWALRNGYGWDQIASGEAAHIAAPLLADIGKKVQGPLLESRRRTTTGGGKK